MKAIEKLYAQYKVEGLPHLRLGQYFCNKYVKKPWPELFYKEDEQVALAMIEKYLIDLQYEDSLPPAIRTFGKAYDKPCSTGCNINKKRLT